MGARCDKRCVCMCALVSVHRCRVSVCTCVSAEDMVSLRRCFCVCLCVVDLVLSSGHGPGHCAQTSLSQENAPWPRTPVHGIRKTNLFHRSRVLGDRVRTTMAALHERVVPGSVSLEVSVCACVVGPLGGSLSQSMSGVHQNEHLVA